MATRMLPLAVALSVCIVRTAAFSSSFSGPIGSTSSFKAGLQAKCQGRSGAAISALRMGGGNVPRVPYKAPGEDSYQV
jgi:hypothetical protein